MIRPSTCRLTPVAVLLTGLLLLVALDGTSSTPGNREDDDAFLRALQDRNLALALRLAKSDERTGIVDGLEHCLAGRFREAEEQFHRLIGSADSLTRTLALEAEGQLLYLLGRWAELAELPVVTGTEPALQETERNFFRFFTGKPTLHAEFRRDSSSVPMRLKVSSNPMVEARVHGRKVRAAWDTGAGICIISSSLARRLSISRDEGSSASVTSASAKQLTMRAGMIDSVDLGEVRWRHVPVGILDDRLLEFRLAGIPIAGFDLILGWPLMQHLDMTLDFGNERLHLRKPTVSSETKHDLTWYGMPVVKTFSDRTRDTLYFQLDFGGYPTQHFPALHSRLTDTLDIAREAARIGGAGGYTNYEAAMLRDITLRAGGHEKRYARLTERLRSDALELVKPEGVFGVGFAEDEQVRIDFTNGIFAVSPSPEED